MSIITSFVNKTLLLTDLSIR